MSAGRERPFVVAFRVNDAELELINEHAARSFLSRADYMRGVLLGAPVRVAAARLPLARRTTATET